MNDAATGSTLAQDVFVRLADGELHAGSELAATLAVSRTAVWKAVSGLRALGVAIESVPRQGYRAAHAFTPLAEQRVTGGLPPAVRARLRTGEVLWSTASTNALLLAQPGSEPGRFDYRIAEHQTAGRGRRGRRWLAPPGGALCLSLNWSYAALPPGIGALSLAVGVGIWRVMRRFGLTAPQLDRRSLACDGWDSLPTVFPFLLLKPDGGCFSLDQMREAYRRLALDADGQVLLGQPTPCGARWPTWSPSTG